MPSRAACAIIAIGLLLIVRPGVAQDGPAVIGIVSANPGARSMGFGGAFAALADDATAAFANPAGLVQLPRPEISAEVRFTLTTAGAGTPLAFTPDITGVGFASFVYPHGRWAFALYSHQLASVDFSVLAPLPSASTFTVQSYAAAAAFEVNERLGLGVGLSYFDGDRDSSASSAAISDSDWGVNGGVLWRVSRLWSLAGFYRQGPEFSVDVPSLRKSSTAPPALPRDEVGALSRLAFPNVYGLGAALRPSAGTWILGLEWDHLEVADEPQQPGVRFAEGGDEYHVGAEYAVLRWRPVIAFRAGIWRELAPRRVVATGFETLNIAGGDQTHYALGLGLAFTRVQFDVGLDLSQHIDILSLSMVYSF